MPGPFIIAMPRHVFTVQPLPAGADNAIRPGDDLARGLRGFGLPGLAAIVVILAGNAVFIPLSAILVLLWAWCSRTPWRDIGYVRPRSWLATVATGVVFGALFKLVMKSVVMPLLGADPVNQAFHFLAGNTAALPAMMYAVIVGAGFGEETIFRGYVFERLGTLLGRGVPMQSVIVLISAAWFGIEHYPVQGLAGAQQATIVGLVFGGIYAATRQLPVLMIAHAAFDVTAVAIIYWDVEAAVARLFFR
jgi:membrane protease YdiL (CAAX protease family)